MSNLDAQTDVVVCQEKVANATNAAPVEVLTPREVPLGGLRAMPVRRTLPQRQRSLIGAWCFADHYGPDLVSETGGMSVAPHPHTGLQTVSWLFAGEIEHRDSIGSHAMVRPGELNLMTGGKGIAHSEVSTAATTVLHGMQLWVALPEDARHSPPAFEHYAPEAVAVNGGRVSVFLGSTAGQTSPVVTFSPLLGVEVVVEPGATVELDVDPRFEHGAILDQGSIDFEGTVLARAELGYVPPGRSLLRLHNPGTEDARIVVLGGTPFGEQILMWWNFVGRSNDEIRAFREQWQSEVAAPGRDDPQFGDVVGYVGDWIPAPTLPSVPLKPRG
ncbi:pirin family protein [Antrihabitans cavernicola]|uniref:Pirin family protein n=1 Tax=Antrihabitans cavernicola TaxID=2495913 RepID=A0A5A7S8G0_9NOCA|nr:pirin family protein [Spelaeibacter cavernicola]KAA0021764.1 pirin family protein [Spelaeibacter cavernicola]